MKSKAFHKTKDFDFLQKILFNILVRLWYTKFSDTIYVKNFEIK